MRVILFAGALFFVGCGGPDAACDTVVTKGSLSLETCVEWNGISDEGVATAKQFCASRNNATARSKVVTSCPTDGIVGSCRPTSGGADAFTTSVQYFYAIDGVTVAESQQLARESCESDGGSWDPS